MNKIIIILISCLWIPTIITAQEKVTLPSSILSLKEKNALYQKEAQLSFIKFCQSAYNL